MSAQDIADALKGVVSSSTTPDEALKFFAVTKRAGTAMGLSWLLDNGMTTAQAATFMKNSIVTFFTRMGEVEAIAANRGYLLPDNPYKRFVAINKIRRLWQPLEIGIAEQELLWKSTIDLAEVTAAYDAGTVKFDKVQPSSQLAMFEVSVDGMSPQSGDALVDILGYQPDADFIKRKRALDSLSKLDFSKRKPYMLFVSDVMTNGRRQDGTVVCWMKMRDASGYAVSKRDVFSNVNYPEATLSNDGLQKSTAELLLSDSFIQALSFYDWVKPEDVFAFTDESNRLNTLYSYEVSGLQKRMPASPFIFDVPTTALYLSPNQIADVRTAIIQELGVGVDADTISPYPAMSQVIYGDPGFGWIIAGCNVLASQHRGDSVDQTRSISYIGSKSSDLLNQAAAGRMVIPQNIATINQSVDNCISSFGVSQTMLSLLDGVGLTFFASGKDDISGFQPTQQSLESATGGLAKILSSIDPVTATIDTKTLATNLTVSAHINVTKYTTNPLKSSAGGNAILGTATDLANAPRVQQGNLADSLGSGVMDLTTYEGISKLMQTLRLIYDFFPGSLS